MKNLFLTTATTAAALCFAGGCSSSRNGQVSYRQDGTKVYGLSSQPQSQIGGESPLMEGVYGSRDQSGRFTGRETGDRIGLATTSSRTDSRDLSQNAPPPQVGSGIVPEGVGAGSLGQSGIQTGQSITSSTILGSSANPPNIATTPTLAEPLTRNAGANIDSISNVGRPSGAEVGLGQGSSSPLFRSPFQENPTITGAGTGTRNPDLSTQIRQSLQQGPAGSISTLPVDRVQGLEVETINGNVTLRGVARTEVEKLMIENKVAGMPGVTSVNNQLRVLDSSEGGVSNPASPENRANLPFEKRAN